MNFFKKFLYSILKIEKYPDMAAEGVRSAIIYMSKIILIVAIIISLGMMYRTYNLLNQGVNYLKNEFPEFSYKEGTLDIENEEKIEVSEETSPLGKVIIDTKTEDSS